jgi:CHAT domain-containing protein
MSHAKSICWRLVLAGIVLAGTDLAAAASPTDAQRELDQGLADIQSGAFPAASEHCALSAADFAARGEDERQCQALWAEATALCDMGKYPQAIATLTVALQAAGENQRLKTVTTIHLAEAMILSRNDEMGNSRLPTAQAELQEAQDAAGNDAGAKIALAAAWGDLYLAELKPDLAAAAYGQSLAGAQAAGDDGAAARAAANGALAWLTELKAVTNPDRFIRSRAQRRQDAAQAAVSALAVRNMDEQAMAAAAKLPASHDVAYLWLTIGQTEEGLGGAITAAGPGIVSMPGPDPNLVAYSAYQSGLNVATTIDDIAGQAYALGFTGHLYELSGRRAEAMVLTRQAVFLAQQIQDADCLYRWQWQTARLLRGSDDAAALECYRRAAMTLQSIRTDIGAGGGNQPASASFHGVAEGVFYELADLLLRHADSAGADEAAAQHDLLESRDTIEQLKTAQVQNYFHERCDALLQRKGVDVAGIDARTAVVYLIPLPDRTEILVAEPAPVSALAPGGYRVRRFRAEVSDAELTRTVRRFRLELMDVTSNDYAPTAVQLYDWLIRPMEGYLAGRGVDTLVFIPDGALRTIPMGALSDGHQYLIEKFAVAVSPGLKLTEPRSLTESQVRLLSGGLSVSRQTSRPLPSVRQELSNLSTLYGGESLLDASFKVRTFDDAMASNDYSVVHIASHGQFGDDPSQTFVQAFDGHMDLNHLEQVIEPSKYKGHAVELLTLSACETAAGNDRAALGLAGVALKAGARSALATLWSVNDEASADLIDDFYRRLKTTPGITKAQAMRQAQMQLIENSGDVRFVHPFFWSPYLIIGNWL